MSKSVFDLPRRRTMKKLKLKVKRTEWFSWLRLFDARNSTCWSNCCFQNERNLFLSRSIHFDRKIDQFIMQKVSSIFLLFRFLCGFVLSFFCLFWSLSKSIWTEKFFFFVSKRKSEEIFLWNSHRNFDFLFAENISMFSFIDFRLSSINSGRFEHRRRNFIFYQETSFTEIRPAYSFSFLHQPTD